MRRYSASLQAAVQCTFWFLGQLLRKEIQLYFLNVKKKSPGPSKITHWSALSTRSSICMVWLRNYKWTGTSSSISFKQYIWTTTRIRPRLEHRSYWFWSPRGNLSDAASPCTNVPYGPKTWKEVVKIIYTIMISFPNPANIPAWLRVQIASSHILYREFRTLVYYIFSSKSGGWESIRI